MPIGAPHINGFSNCTGAATPLEGLQLPRGKSVTVEGKGPVSAFKVVSKSCHNAPKKDTTVGNLDIMERTSGGDI